MSWLNNASNNNKSNLVGRTYGRKASSASSTPASFSSSVFPKPSFTSSSISAMPELDAEDENFWDAPKSSRAGDRPAMKPISDSSLNSTISEDVKTQSKRRIATQVSSQDEKIR